MKITSISVALFFSMAVLWDRTSAQDFSGKCLYTETKCFTDDGTSCRKIKQETQDKGCGQKKVTISSKWCNFTNKNRRIYENQGPALTLTGPAATFLYNRQDVTFSSRGLGGDIDRNECQEKSWTTSIDTCKAFFNYEVNVFASDIDQPQCRGYNFARQMKSRCKLNGSVSCTVLDGKNGGAGTPCEEVKPCDYFNGDDKAPECFKDVRYDFVYKNNNNQPVRFDLEGEKVTRALVAWKPVPNARSSFSGVISRKTQKSFSHVREKVNVCRSLPSATLNLRANVVDPKTNGKDADFRFCFNFDSWKVVRFTDTDRVTCSGRKSSNAPSKPLTKTPTPAPSPLSVGHPSKGKNSGGKPSKRRFK